MTSPAAEQAPAIEERKKEEKVDASIKKAFKMFDADGDGGLDVIELINALDALGVNANRAKAEEVLKKYDTAKKGSLSLLEFEKMVLELQVGPVVQPKSKV